jgi:hypothetical protein
VFTPHPFWGGLAARYFRLMFCFVLFSNERGIVLMRIFS